MNEHANHYKGQNFTLKSVTFSFSFSLFLSLHYIFFFFLLLLSLVRDNLINKNIKKIDDTFITIISMLAVFKWRMELTPAAKNWFQGGF